MKYFILLLAGCTLAGTKNQCETQADCLDGFTCSTAGTCEQSISGCTPITCDGHCGTLDDHCQGTLDCGACPDHCTNGAPDPGETDVDCGGDCMPCATNLHCVRTTDCATGTCDDGTCRTGTWATAAAMPTARSGLAAVVAGGKIYAIGGQSSNGESNAVEVYDPVADSWSSRAAMPTPRDGLAAVLGSDGRIYAIGGNYTSITSPGPSIVAEVYDPGTNAWTALPSLPVGRSDLAAAWSGDTLYAIGGLDGSTLDELGSVATWKIGDASWSLTDSLTTARSAHAAAVMPDGKILVTGGEHDLAGNEIGAFEYYQPGMVGWNTLVAMPTPRKFLAATTIGSAFYAIAGNHYVAANMVYSRVVEVYATAWTQVTSIPSGRFGHAAVTLGGKIYVLGGRREDVDSLTATVDVFTP